MTLIVELRLSTKRAMSNIEVTSSYGNLLTCFLSSFEKENTFHNCSRMNSTQSCTASHFRRTGCTSVDKTLDVKFCRRGLFIPYLNTHFYLMYMYKFLK